MQTKNTFKGRGVKSRKNTKYNQECWVIGLLKTDTNLTKKLLNYILCKLDASFEVVMCTKGIQPEITNCTWLGNLKVRLNALPAIDS